MMPTTPPRGIRGGTGLAAGVVPWVMTSGLYLDGAGPRVEDVCLDEGPQVRV